MRKVVLTVVAMLFGWSSVASAGSISFFGEDLNGVETARLVSTPNSDAARDQFFSQLIAPNTADLENLGLPPNDLTELPPPFSIPFGPETALASGYTPGIPTGFFLRNIPTGTDGGGGYPTSGNQYIVQYQVDSVYLDFSAPQVAFGLYVGDAGDAGGNFSVTLHMIGGATETISAPHTQGIQAQGAKFYLGVVSDNPFERISLNNLPGGDGFVYDDLTIAATAIPEPSTAFLLGIGLASLAVRREKR